MNWRRWLETLRAYSANEEPRQVIEAGSVTITTDAMDALRDFKAGYGKTLLALSERIARDELSKNEWGGPQIKREHVEDAAFRINDFEMCQVRR